MASPSGCLLTRCGVMGRPPGAQARPRWPQLLTANPGWPGSWVQGAAVDGAQRQREEGPGGGSIGAGLARASPPGNEWRQPGGQEGGGQAHPACLPAPAPEQQPEGVVGSTLAAHQQALVTPHCSSHRGPTPEALLASRLACPHPPDLLWAQRHRSGGLAGGGERPARWGPGQLRSKTTGQCGCQGDWSRGQGGGGWWGGGVQARGLCDSRQPGGVTSTPGSHPHAVLSC